MSSPYDLYVIGGGSGGIACARRAASHGAKVGVAEASHWGGTCVNVGCVPKKIMWWGATVSEIIDSCASYGYKLDKASPFDWAALVERRNASVHRLRGLYLTNLGNNKIDHHDAFASFKGRRDDGIIELLVGDELIAAKRVLIAVGGYPSRLGIEGEEYTINSDGFFDLEKQPKKVAVIGAGYIALELAQIFRQLGTDGSRTETHLFCRGEYILRRFDSMIAREASVSFAAGEPAGHFHPQSTPSKITKETDGSLTLHLEGGDSVGGFDQILVAVGRSPKTDKLMLGSIGVDTERRGHIAVDDYQNTTADNVFALGDVCGKVELTPMAIAAGRTLADRLFLVGHETDKVSYDLVPTVIFNHPPIGTIGLSEKEAKHKYGVDDVVVYKNVSVNLFYNVQEMKPRTHIKLVCHKSDNERVVGLHIFGMGADEMLQGFGVAIKMGATKADFDRCVAIHPSAAEEVVTCAPWGLPHPDMGKLKTVFDQ